MTVSVHSSANSFKPRTGEFSSRLPERSKRFFVEDDQWYFRTREREAVGPYANKENAHKAAKTFSRFCRSVREDQLRVLIRQHLERLNKMSEQQRAMPLRDGEMEVPSERHDRVLNKKDGWFFSTREGQLVGPFSDEEMAKDSADTFTKFAINVKGEHIYNLIATMNGTDAEEVAF